MRGVTHTRVTQGWLLCVTWMGGGAERREHEDAPWFWGLVFFPADLSRAGSGGQDG